MKLLKSLRSFALSAAALAATVFAIAMLIPKIALAADGELTLDGIDTAMKAGILAGSAFIVRALIVWRRPWLQRKIKSTWPSAGWAGWLVTAALSAAVAVCSELVLGQGWDWALLQTAFATVVSIATTPGMDAKTAAEQRPPEPA